MSIDKTKLVNVLNYNMNPVAIQTHVKEYLCPPATDESTPSITPLSLSEIESMGSKDAVFKIGLLRFPKEVEQEIYEDYLRMTDWKDILTNEQIKDIILHPSIDGLSKFVAIKSSALFERVRGIFYMLKNSNAYDISNRVEAVVLRRYKELCNQQVKTSIELTSKDTATAIPNEEVNALKEANKNMQVQLEAMQKMMEQMMAMQANTVQKQSEIKEDINLDNNTENNEAKKAGRPSNKNIK